MEAPIMNIKALNLTWDLSTISAWILMEYTRADVL